MAIVAIDRRSPARTHTTGTNQMLERTLLNNRKSRTNAPYPLRGALAEMCRITRLDLVAGP